MSSETIEINVDIAARRELLFSFLTDPARAETWLGRGNHLGARPGEKIALHTPTGAPTHGKILDIAPPRRLVLTFEAADAGSGSVTITLEQGQEGSKARLVHSGLPSADMAQQHRMAWMARLSALANVSAREEGDDAAARAVEHYFAAWNADTADEIDFHLARCWATDGTFRDPHAAISGRDDLSAWIKHAQLTSNGAGLARRGTPSHCQGTVRFGWEARLGERILGTGINFGRLDREHRFIALTGFWN